MNLTRAGIHFNYHGDDMLWIWPWKRTDSSKYYSSVYDRGFSSLRNYWFFVGTWTEAMRKKKIIGFSELDIFKRWAELNFNHNIVLILRNINVEMKSTVFWKSIDPLNRIELLKDCPVLFFHEIDKALSVAQSMTSEFAEAYLFVYGKLIYNNNEIKAQLKYDGDFIID